MMTTMTVTVMTTTGGPESSDDCLRDTVTGDEKLPPPTAVTAWICEYGMGLVVHNLITLDHLFELFAMSTKLE